MKSPKLYILIFYLLYENVESDVDLRRFTFRRDISEHCRRQVMPSVFLGMHVMVAKAQVLHFTSLEEPYNCFISIRAESGSNIVLVFELGTDDLKLCRSSKVRRSGEADTDDTSNTAGPSSAVGSGEEGTVVVYEMGETFGGYWGPMPSFPPPKQCAATERYYTQKTLPDAPEEQPIAKTVVDGYYINKEDDNISNEDDANKKREQDSSPEISQPPSFVFEIPIMNVSGAIVDSNETFQREAGDEDLNVLDFRDIVIKPGDTDSTKIMQIMQFSPMSDRRLSDGDDQMDTETEIVKENIEDTRKDDGAERRYQIDVDIQGFTYDPRLLYAYDAMDTPTKRYNYGVNKILHFTKKKRPLLLSRSTISTVRDRNFNDTWSYIEALLKNVTNEQREQMNREKQLDTEKFAALVQKVADWQQNYSIYLAPNLTNMNESFNPITVTLPESSIAKSTTTEISTAIQTTNNPVLEITETLVTKSLVQNSLPTSTVSLQEITTNRTSVNTSYLSTAVSEFSMATMQKSVNLTRNIEDIIVSFANTIDTQDATPQDLKSVSTISSNEQIKASSETAISYLTTKVTELSMAALQNMENLSRKYIMKNIFSVLTSQTHTGRDISSRFTISSSILSATPMMGSIANRESWGNVVQVAPKIAGLLTDTVSPFVTRPVTKTRKSAAERAHMKKKNQNEFHAKADKKRRKRSIRAIPIYNARPHNQTTNAMVSTTAVNKYYFRDAIDFARLVELRDDGLYGHISLFNMGSLVGPKLLDLCDDNNQARLVHLFNTSRIVVSLNNFTWSRMTITATPVRTLTRPDMRCDNTSLECQLSGARVCVDNLNACDGIPNCGINNIYDEDRIMCGGMSGLRHSMYLSAFTFLLVLLTLLYVLYYWLKRCIPPVSEAFFIYTDGTENILHTKPVMKSPQTHDDDSDKQLLYQSHLFEIGFDIAVTKQDTTKCNIFKKMFAFFRGKKRKCNDIDLSEEFIGNPLGRLYSFTENEIHKMTKKSVETGVQTGESLELSYVNERKSSGQTDKNKWFDSVEKKISPIQKRVSDTILEEDLLVQSSEDSELSLMKFFRQARISSLMWDESAIALQDMQAANERASLKEERELGSIDYDREGLRLNKVIPSADQNIKLDVLRNDSGQGSDVPGPSGLKGKRLRFDDKLTTIPSNLDSDYENQSRNTEMDVIDASPGKEFMRFWSKKIKKKSHATCNK